MSIPGGITTVLVSVLPQTTGPVLPGTVQVTVTPTQNLVWSATGQSLASMCAGASTSAGWVTLPAVDQAGFVTPDTRVGVTDWTYLVSVSWTQSDGSQHTESGSVQCFSNQQITYLSGASGTLQPTVSYPIGGLALSGWEATYSALPTTLGPSQAGAAYLVQSDGLLYIWSGTQWPASGHGFSIAGPVGGSGPTGPVGPSNTLSIGSVTIGTPVSASLTGSSPSQTLNLVLPEARWWTGSGAPGTVSGSVNGDMYLDNSGDGNLYQLQSGTWVSQGSIKGPAGSTGATGATGPANSLSIGTVTNGGSAAATITGSAPSQTLNLTLPQGPTGATGPTGPANVQVPTAVKTGAYTAASGDWVVCDGTSGGFTITLPTAPADKTTIIIQKVDSSANAITISRGGSDTFNTASGPTSISLQVQRATAMVQYAATPAIWYVRYGLDLVPLDSRYAPLASPALTGTPTAPTATAGTSTTQLATTAYVATSYAPLASPALTGTPTAPTATAGTSTTQVATTSFVETGLNSLNLTSGGTITMQAAKTTAYTAAAGDCVPVNASSAGVTITLPTAPWSGVRVTIIKSDSSQNLVTVAAGGSDVINASGTTSLILRSQFACATLEYNSGVWYNQEAAAPCKFTWLVQSGTRASGYGDMPEGVYLDQAASIYVRWRAGTADASGSNTVALYSNTANSATGTAVGSGSVTLTATSAGAVSSWVGPFAVAAGTYLQTNVTALATTPGARLYMDVIGSYL